MCAINLCVWSLAIWIALFCCGCQSDYLRYRKWDSQGQLLSDLQVHHNKAMAGGNTQGLSVVLPNGISIDANSMIITTDPNSATEMGNAGANIISGGASGAIDNLTD